MIPAPASSSSIDHLLCRWGSRILAFPSASVVRVCDVTVLPAPPAAAGWWSGLALVEDRALAVIALGPGAACPSDGIRRAVLLATASGRLLVLIDQVERLAADLECPTSADAVAGADADAGVAGIPLGWLRSIPGRSDTWVVDPGAIGGGPAVARTEEAA